MMLTTKTLGRDAGCVVMSIGAVMFDPQNPMGKEFQRPENQFFTPISSFDSATHGLQSDLDTLRWWRKQEAWSTVGSDFINCSVTVENACQAFDSFFKTSQPQRVWCNSPTFHVPILSALYQKVGMSLPFTYQDEMDYKTAMGLAYGERIKRPEIEKNHNFFRHHALGDAISQSTALIKGLEDMKNLSSALVPNQRWMMMDIESLGRRPGNGILSVGACVFDSELTPSLLENPSNHYYGVLSTFDLTNNGFQTDSASLKWWKEKEIWKSLSSQVMHSSLGVKRACEDFSEFVKEQAKPEKIWANSPSFHIEMLKCAFRKMNVNFPIKYQDEMDYRTLMNLAYPERSNRPARLLTSMPVEHHSLGDSIEQTFQTGKALQSLGLIKKDPSFDLPGQDRLLKMIEKKDAGRRSEENAQKASNYIKTLPKSVSRPSHSI